MRRTELAAGDAEEEEPVASSASRADARRNGVRRCCALAGSSPRPGAAAREECAAGMSIARCRSRWREVDVKSTASWLQGVDLATVARQPPQSSRTDGQST